MIVCSSKSSTPASARATISWDLPFCRGVDTPTSRAAHRPSARSPIAASSTFSCHSSSFTPSDADRSATSSQELARTRGALLTLGGACPPSSTPLRDLVNSVTHLLRRCQFGDLGQNRLQPAGERGQVTHRLAALDRGGEVVTELLQGGEPVTGRGRLPQRHEAPLEESGQVH